MKLFRTYLTDGRQAQPALANRTSKRDLAFRQLLMAGVFCLALATLMVQVAQATSQGLAGLSSDPDRLLQSVVKVNSTVVPDGRTVAYLGDTRTGSGVILDEQTVLTIGYLILEADEVELTSASGRKFPASVLAYDHATGFGLVRSALPLDGQPMTFGESNSIDESEYLLSLDPHDKKATEVVVVSTRPFSGSWEYLLERALFTFPPIPNWSGAALTNKRGELVGIGSLMVDDAAQASPKVAGNMFVPTDLIKPILADLRERGKRAVAPQPWLGLSTEMLGDELVAVRVSEDGPAALAGLAPGDKILAVADKPVQNQRDFYRQLWQVGDAGVQVKLTVSRDGFNRDFSVKSDDRMRYLKRPQGI
ncbi:MAG: S1C family serine protease [Burkholderiaceae bacterium]